ncbi:hypothetical protein OG806_07340 [Streptomyces sp. NBC_00882]|uniref:hypothetical protein n=1 Tax=Streptomyces sp. NBC_00882 TaxID=2975856 RepID=UPI003870C97F|nr:hypothetical protein OG806_07340 [Streptomyces sp. NBC_00882]
MSEGRESSLRQLAATLRQARGEAEGRGDAWSVAVHTVDLEEVERVGRELGVDLAGGASQSGAVRG